MEYISFIEHSYKENETFIFFLQYTGNEESLTKLSKLISSANYTYMSGDYSNFDMDIIVKLSESTVNELIQLPFGYFSRMFQKVNGKLSYDFLEEKFDNEMIPEEIAETLDEYFGNCHIKYYFK